MCRLLVSLELMFLHFFILLSISSVIIFENYLFSLLTNIHLYKDRDPCSSICFRRFDSASDHYSELLTVITGENCVQNKAANPECSVVTLPRAGCIYKQAIVCHIRANNFDTAISLCQHFLSKTKNSSDGSSSEPSGGIASRQSKTKRSRKHVNEGGSIPSYSSTEDQLLESEILALQADAMCKTDFKDEALSTLTKQV